MEIAILALVALIAALESWRLWNSFRGRHAYFRAATHATEVANELSPSADEWIVMGHSWSSDGRRKTFNVEFQDRASFEAEKRI